jgi:TPR repeat protein
VFEEGQRLYGEQRFSEAAERWGRAALLQHAPSHAHLSDMLIDGRAGVAKDVKRAFALAAAGAALGCAHSKGALGRCYVGGYGVAEDAARGLALGRESAPYMSSNEKERSFTFSLFLTIDAARLPNSALERRTPSSASKREE